MIDKDKNSNFQEPEYSHVVTLHLIPGGDGEGLPSCLGDETAEAPGSKVCSPQIKDYSLLFRCEGENKSS